MKPPNGGTLRHRAVVALHRQDTGSRRDVAFGHDFFRPRSLSSFIDRNPTFKLLALSFLVLIGVMLFAEGAGTPINKGYIYAAVVFALVIEMINMRIRKRARTKAAEAST
jgi:hypothetical protein